MPRDYEDVKQAVLKDVAEAMCVAARTAPKTRGQDHLIIALLKKEEKPALIAKMKELAATDDRPSLSRDAGNIEAADQVVLIGVKRAALGLDCGFCGFKTCAGLEKSGGVCVYNPMDLGIALGSAAALASRAHVDNRLMYSIGKAALALGLLGKDAGLAIGVPLSATGKNPYFDRK
ncbi:MAG: DUF2148 domain-containing protein [Elusimicrobiota bacterium]